MAVAGVVVAAVVAFVVTRSSEGAPTQTRTVVYAGPYQTTKRGARIESPAAQTVCGEDELWLRKGVGSDMQSVLLGTGCSATVGEFVSDTQVIVGCSRGADGHIPAGSATTRVDFDAESLNIVSKQELSGRC